MKQSLREILSAWDGKHTEPLKKAFDTCRSHSEFPGLLVELCEVECCQRGATWLLKHHFDSKGPALSDELTGKHLAALGQLRHWEAKLHVLQYLEHLNIPNEAETELFAFLEDTRASENKLVRAWAYFGLATLACRFPDRREAAIDRLEQAQSVETAGSIKVRIRKALAKLKK